MSFLHFEWAFIPHGADTGRTRGSPSDALCGMSLLIIFLMIISGSVFAIVYIVKHPGPPSPPSMHARADPWQRHTATSGDERLQGVAIAWEGVHDGMKR